MDFILQLIYVVIGSIFFGLVMEAKVTAFSKVKFLFDGKVTDDDRLLGYVPLWMIFVYGMLLPAVFIPVLRLLIYLHIPFYIRYFIWCISITGFEAGSGWVFNKGLFKFTSWLSSKDIFFKKPFHIRPWDYSSKSDSILNGYTRWKLIPLWGVAGMILEIYISFLVLSSHQFPVFVRALFKTYF